MATVISLGTITLDAARLALDAAIKEARDQTQQVSVAVVGRMGDLRAFASMDDAFALSREIAQQKAYSVTTGGGVPTSMLESLVGHDAVFERLLQVDRRMMPIGGGVPLLVGGQCVGAVGVSGAMTAQLDHDIAQVGADAVL